MIKISNISNPMKLNNHKIDRNQVGIYAHSNIAKYYKYRPPYLNEFFTHLALKLTIQQDDSILDLCCGRGELATGVSKFAKKIDAVDGSPEMLAHSFKDEKIHYHLCNVNLGSLPFEDKFNHILIGTAIHWIRDYALTPIIDNNLAPKGKICIIHRTLELVDQEVDKSLRMLNSKYGAKFDREPDFFGADKLKKSGFQEVDRFKLQKMVSFDLQYLYLNQMSRAYGVFQKNIMVQPNNYKQDFIAAISPHLNGGILSAKLKNYAVIYSEI